MRRTPVTSQEVQALLAARKQMIEAMDVNHVYHLGRLPASAHDRTVLVG